jgi:hypothetical protein
VLLIAASETDLNRSVSSGCCRGHRGHGRERGSITIRFRCFHRLPPVPIGVLGLNVAPSTIANEMDNPYGFVPNKSAAEHARLGAEHVDLAIGKADDKPVFVERYRGDNAILWVRDGHPRDVLRVASP